LLLGSFLSPSITSSELATIVGKHLGPLSSMVQSLKHLSCDIHRIYLTISLSSS